MTDATTRFVLVTPQQFDPAKFAPTFAAALASADVSAAILDLDGDDDAWRAAADALIPVAHAAGVPLLVSGRTDLVRELGADGAHVAGDAATVRAAQGELKPELIVGAGDCTMRHAAMTIGETLPDYLFLGRLGAEDVTAAQSLVEWWVQLFEVPCVALAAEEWGDVDRLVGAGADFVALRNLVWADSRGPAKALEHARALAPGRRVSAA